MPPAPEASVDPGAILGPRVVIDTNVIVSAALFSQSVPRKVIEAVRLRGTIILSVELRAELLETLRRPKFDRYVPLSERLALLDLLASPADDLLISTASGLCRDPKDDMVLATAAAGGADFIVSGDADLLDMLSFQGIPPLSPCAFLARLG